MKYQLSSLLPLVLCLVLMAACTADPNAIPVVTPTLDAAAPAGDPSDAPAQALATTAPTLAATDRKSSQVQLALVDLSERLGVPVVDIEVTAVEEVTWSDTSLGCPQPNTLYGEALTPGFLVLLTANDSEFSYHTDDGEQVILCEDSTMPAASDPMSPIEPGMEPLVSLAVADLAQRLAVEESAVEVLEAKPVVWPDPSMGCPQPGMAYKQVPQDGSLIRLAVDGLAYAYHGGGNRVPFLCEQVMPKQKTKTLPLSLDDFPSTSESVDD